MSRALTVPLAVVLLAGLLLGTATPVAAGATLAESAPEDVDCSVPSGWHSDGAGPPSATDQAADISSGGGPSFRRIAPNPRAYGDAGEFVVVAFPERTETAGWTIVDDSGARASLPSMSVSGAVALSPEPTAVPKDVGGPVRELDGRLRLANGGDVIRLVAPNGTTVDRVSYDRAGEGERLRRVRDGWRWRAAGATDRSPATTTPANATAFVLPDAGGDVSQALAGADDRILLAGYTLTSRHVADELVAAAKRNATVQVLLDGSPVGGISRREVAILDRLVAAGVEVRMRGGERDPYRFHHAKYAVIDDRALVLTENFKPAGTGGHSSRGWGVIVRDGVLANELASLFRADVAGPGAIEWQRYRETVDPVASGSASRRFPTHFTPETVPVRQARLLVAPDNARRELGRLIRSANHSVRIQQMSIDGRDDALLRAAIAAARNGTEVEVLLSGASYVRPENRRLVAALDRLAEREELPISASIAEPRGRFGKIHAKGVIVDRCHVAIGSLNWNPTAYGENREVVVVLTGRDVAEYYVDVFETDQRNAALWPVPLGLVGSVAGAWLLLALLGVARIRWAST